MAATKETCNLRWLFTPRVPHFFAYVTIWRFKYSVKMLIAVNFLGYHHSSVVWGIGLVNRTSWVQIRWRLLLKVTEISFWKSYFYQKNEFSFAFCTFISVICYFIFIIKLFRLDWRNFIQVWWATLKVC